MSLALLLSAWLLLPSAAGATTIASLKGSPVVAGASVTRTRRTVIAAATGRQQRRQRRQDQRASRHEGARHPVSSIPHPSPFHGNSTVARTGSEAP